MAGRLYVNILHRKPRLKESKNCFAVCVARKPIKWIILGMKLKSKC